MHPLKVKIKISNRLCMSSYLCIVLQNCQPSSASSSTAKHHFSKFPLRLLNWRNKDGTIALIVTTHLYLNQYQFNLKNHEICELSDVSAEKQVCWKGYFFMKKRIFHVNYEAFVVQQEVVFVLCVWIAVVTIRMIKI